MAKRKHIDKAKRKRISCDECDRVYHFDREKSTIKNETNVWLKVWNKGDKLEIVAFNPISNVGKTFLKFCSSFCFCQYFAKWWSHRTVRFGKYDPDSDPYFQDILASIPGLRPMTMEEYERRGRMEFNGK